MILATLALAFAPEAHACSPGPAAIVAQAPAADQHSVPVDALIRFQIGEGEIQDEVRISVRVDGDPVPGVLRTFDPGENPFKQAPLYSFDPDEDLPSDTRIDVQVGLTPTRRVLRQPQPFPVRPAQTTAVGHRSARRWRDEIGLVPRVERQRRDRHGSTAGAARFS